LLYSGYGSIPVFQEVNANIVLITSINFATPTSTQNKSEGVASSFTLPVVNSNPASSSLPLTYTVTGAPSFFSFGPETTNASAKTCNLSASAYAGGPWTLTITATFTGATTKTATMTVTLNVYSC